MDDKRKVLYDQLSKDYELGDFDSFSAKLDDESKRKAFYDAVSKDYDLGDYESFVGKIKKPAAQIIREQSTGEPYTHKYDGQGNLVGGTAYETPEPYHYKPEVQQHIAENIPSMFKSNNVSLMDKPLGDSASLPELSDDKFQARIDVAQKNLQDPEVQKARTDAHLRGLSASVDTDLNDIEDRIVQRKKAVRNENWKPGMPSSRNDRGLSELRGERSYLEGAKELIEESQKIVTAANDEKDGTFVGGVLRGVRDKAFDVDNWTMGISDLVGGLRLKKVLEDYEAGKQLSPAQEKLLDAAITNMATSAWFESDLGRGYKAGQVTGESLPFMLEMMVNPISASGNAMAKSLLTAGLKRFGSVATNKVVKAGTRLATDALAATGMAATTGLPGVLGESVDRMNRNYEYGFDADGNLNVTKTGDTSFGEALGRSFTTRALENQSEMIFNAFRGVGAMMRGVERYIPGGVNRFFYAMSNSKVGQLWREIKNSPLRKEIAQAAQIGGIGEEYLEEVYNNMANVALGEMSFEEAIDLDRNIDTFLGLAPTQVMFSMLGLGNMAAVRYQTRRDIDRLRKGMTEEQQSKLDELLSMGTIENGVDVRGFIRNVMADNSLTPEQKRTNIEAAYDVAKQNAIDEITNTDIEDTIEAENAQIDAATDPQTGLYGEVNVVSKDLDGNDVISTANVFGEKVVNGELYLLVQVEGETEKKWVRPNQYDAATYEKRPAEEVKSINEEMIREEAAAQAERESKYAPEVLNYVPQLQDQVTDANGQVLTVAGVTPDGVTYLDEQGQVDQMPLDSWRDLMQAQLEANEAQQAQAEEAASNTQAVVDNMPRKTDETGRIFVPKGVQGDEVAYDITDAQGNPLEQGTMKVSQFAKMQDHVAPVEEQLNDDGTSGETVGEQVNSGVNNPDASGVNASPVEEEEQPQTPTLESVVASLPKTNKGEIDYEAMTPQQQYQYTSLSESPEVALEDLQGDIAANEEEIAKIQEQLAKARGGKRSELRDKVKKLTAANDELKSFYESVAPKQETESINGVDSGITEETLENGDIRITKRNSRGEIATIATQRGGKIVSVDSYDEGELFEHTEYDNNGKATSVTRYNKGNPVETVEYVDGKRKIGGEKPKKVKKPRLAGRKKQKQSDFTEEELQPMDALEFAAYHLGLGNVSITTESFKKETGYGEEERKKFMGILRTAEKGGMTVEQAAEKLVSLDNEANGRFFGNDTQAARDTIIELLGYEKWGDVTGLIKNNRLAERKRREEAEYAEYKAALMESLHVTPEEFELLKESIEQRIQDLDVDFDVIDAIFAEAELERQNNEEYEQGRIVEGSQGQSELLSEARTGDLGGNQRNESQQAAEGIGGRVDNNSETSQESASGSEVAPSIEETNVSRMADIEAEVLDIEGRRLEIEDELNEIGNSDLLRKAELIDELSRLDVEQAELEAEYSGLRAMNDESNAISEAEGSGLYFRKAQFKEERRRKPLRERAKQWSDKLGVKVKIMESLDDVTNPSAKRAIARGQAVTGWFEESTGEVCLYMPNITSESEVDATYIHEVVSHKGLRGLLGDKFDSFCDEVWDMMSDVDRLEFMNYPGVSHLEGKEKTRAAADEYIAHLAENIDVTESAWSKFTELLKKFLKALGIEPKMTNADIANTIKKSYRRLLSGAGAEGGVRGEGTRFNAKRVSDRRQDKNRVNNTVDQAVAFVMGKDVKKVKAERLEREQKRKEDAEEIYQSVLSGDFNDVTLQKINDYIDDATPLHPYGRRISQRLPQKLERGLHEGARTNAVDALFSRICESAVPASRRASEAGRREIEERKKEALKGWAIATNNWYTDLSDFADEADFIRQGTDSKVYLAKDGRHVIKVSFGKPEGKRFRPDIDTTALFNSVFRNTAYEIVGYGEFDGKFARILKQPFVDFADKTALNAEEREDYMRTLGFEPINDSKTAFSNGSIVAADLQKSNILKDAAGNISVIDADMKLHTKDVGGNYTYPPVETDLPEGTRFRVVYHGSGASFDRFDHSFMGTGEGNQSFGWGTYVTEVKDIGKGYAKQMGTEPVFSYKGLSQEETYRRYPELQYVSFLMDSGMSAEEAIEKRKKKLEEVINSKDTYWLRKQSAQESLDSYKNINASDIKLVKNRHLYDVEIPENNGTNYLEWDRPLSEEDKKRIKEAVLNSKMYKDYASKYGKGISSERLDSWVNAIDAGRVYRLLENFADNENSKESAKAVSMLLSDAGYTGIEYPAGYMSGGYEDGSKNYVIFNEDDLEIKEHTRFRFIGERGARNLDKAEEATTRLDNLGVAREMEAAFNAKKKRIEKLKDSKPVEITGTEIPFSYDLKQYKKNALEYGKSLQGEYINKDTGSVIQLQRGRKNGGLNEVLQHNYKDKEHIQSVAAIPQIIEEGIYISYEANKDVEKNPDVAEYQHFVCGLSIGGEDYTVHSIVAVDKKGNRYYDHNLIHIEKGNLLDSLIGTTPGLNQEDSKNGFGTTPGTKLTTNSEYKYKRLISILQTNDKENAKKIKMATGWERGGDGKWRYEVDDSISFDTLGERSTKLKKAYSEAQEKYYKFESRVPSRTPKNATEEEKQRIKDMRKELAKLRKEMLKASDAYYGSPIDDTTLGDFIGEDNNLFKEYPELKDVAISFVRNARYINQEFKGFYDPESNSIWIDDWRPKGDIKSSLLHEIQHAIQHIEGFSWGGNAAFFEQAKEEAQNRKYEFNELINKFGFEDWEKNIPFEELMAYGKKYKGEFGLLHLAFIENAIEDKYVQADLRDELESVKAAYNRFYEKAGGEKHSYKTPRDWYLSLGGEVEARNVQQRMGMTDEQRRNTLASETEDVAREDQVFLQNAMEEGTRFRISDKGRKIQSEVDKFVEKYDSKETLLLDLEMTDEELDAVVPELTNEDLKETLEAEKGITGGYSSDTDKIYIFVDNQSLDDMEDTMFHENLHGLFGERSEFIEEFFERAADKLPKLIKKLEKLGYTKEEIPEEAFVRVATAGILNGDLYHVRHYLSEDKADEYVELLNEFAYERRQEFNSRIVGIAGQQTGGTSGEKRKRRTAVQEVDEREDAELQEEARRERKERLGQLFGKVADMGLQGVLGEKAYDNAMMDIYSVLPVDARMEVFNDAYNHYKMDFVPAVSDYIGAKADGSILDKIISIIREALRKVGFDIDLNANEVRYLAWRSQKPLNRVNLLDVAEDIDMRHRMKVGEFEDSSTRFRVAYHGSPSDFVSFDISHMGENFKRPMPYGLYFTDSPEHAKSFSYDKGNGKHLYEVELPDEGFFDMTSEQTKEEKKAILDYIEKEYPEDFKKAKRDIGVRAGRSGNTILEYLSAQDLMNLGYKGVVAFMHPAYTKPNDPKTIRVFDDKIIDIKRHYVQKEGEEDWFDKLETRFRVGKKKASKTVLPEDESSFKGSVVSDADRTKVLNNLDILQKEYEEKSAKRRKTFISDLSKALHLRNNGNNSNYADYVSVNGEEVTIRVSDHNASVKDMDDAGKSNGISIVIGRKSNEGIRDSGNSHIVEYYYNNKKLENSEGNPYTEIINSFKQTVYSGEYKDTTGIAERQEVNPTRFRVTNKLNIRDEYEATVKKGSYQAREAVQDAMLSLRRVQELVEKATGKKLRDFENAWMHENRLSSTVQSAIHEMERKFYKPMTEAVKKLMNAAKIEQEQVADYLMLKHGIERNREMAVRKALTDNEGKIDRDKLNDWYEEKRRIRNDASLDTWRKKQEAMDDAALMFGADMSRDYSGLTSMFDTDDLADCTERAYNEVEALENAHPNETEALGKAIKDMTQSTLDESFGSGLMNKAVYDELSNDMYDYYIPLRGFEETTSDEVYAYLDNERGAFNAPLVRAKGRSSKADNPLAYLKSVAESGIMQGERNKMKQSFLNMVTNHPSDLVSVREGVWVIFNPATGEWEAASFPDSLVPRNATPADVEAAYEQWESDMEQRSLTDPNVKKISEAADVPYRVIGNRMNQHQVIVKRLGKSYTLTVNGNPRLAMALNGQTNPNNTSNDGKVGEFVNRKINAVNRQLAAWYTTRNPDFVASNFMRDTFYTNTIVRAKEGNAYANRFHAHYAKLLMPGKMIGLFRKYENGTLDMSKPVERDFHEFMMNGGETGYSNLKDLEDIKRQIAKDVKGGRWEDMKKAVEKLDILNRAVENTARFAAYRTSRQQGRTVARSIFDAKEISVNFNKKGSGGTFFGATGQTRFGNLAAAVGAGGRALYVFFNAAIQGTTNLMHVMKVNPMGTGAGIGAMFLMGAVVPLLFAGDDDEKDYYDLPEHVRRNHLIIPGTGDAWVSIPLPIEYRIMYGMGELLTSWRTGHERGSDIARKMMNLTGQALPLNFLEEGVDAFMPSALSPLWQVYNNRSWTGLPIYNDNEFNKHNPEYTKAYKNVDKALYNFSKSMYNWTFDEENQEEGINLNPAVIEHIAKGYFGGLATQLSNMGKTWEMAAGERDFDWRNIPVGNRLFKTGDERTKEKRVQNEYFENVDKLEFMQSRERLLRKTKDGAGVPEADKVAAQRDYEIMQGSDVYKRYVSDPKSFKNKKKEADKIYRKRKEKDSEELEKKYFKALEEANKAVR